MALNLTLNFVLIWLILKLKHLKVAFSRQTCCSSSTHSSTWCQSSAFLCAEDLCSGSLFCMSVCVCVCRKGTGMHTRSTCLKRWSSWGSSMQEGSWRSAWFRYSAAVPVLDSESRGCLRLWLFRSFSARHPPHHILAMIVVPTLSSRGQYWLLSLATSLIPITVTPQRSSMTSLMTPPPQVIKAAKIFRKKEKSLFSTSSLFLYAGKYIFTYIFNVNCNPFLFVLPEYFLHLCWFCFSVNPKS